ncbi:nitroreductase [Petrotoga mobilis SJ95]|jgi:nitroreductase|uniref:Nitroreductase n=1 Tax=Petrotoga mobilis (strain DSM 10674 / SJ95) TaxID=403833 RepID=A9BH01_PETMO|nr:nitroreductase family protein [Petrotoga mobilis]ABX32582.1 nitroreductase [Petrotoga mobilis SJ95]
MDVIEIIKQRRCIRKFKQDPIDDEILKELVDCARLAPCASNKQPLEFIIVKDKETCEKVFENLGWASYISPKGTPKEGEKPTAYIFILVNKQRATKWIGHDIGAAFENILLAAWSKGIGGCPIVTINRKNVREILNVPDDYEIDTVIPLGYKGHDSFAENNDEKVEYYMDENGNFHVPKRPLEKVIHFDKF